MFSGTGFRVNGGTFYNVNGDVNLQTHHPHLEIQNANTHAPLRFGGSQQCLTAGDSDAGLGLRPDFDGGGENGPPASGAARNPRHQTTARMRAPYDGSLRPLRSGISSSEPSSDSGASHSAAQNLPVLGSDDRGYSTPHPDAPVPNSPPSLQGGTYITAQNVHNCQGDTGMHILHRSVALEALYDSADSFPPPRCHPETRREILAKSYNWLTEDASAQPMSWLYGPAGAGKSAIMQTLCRQLQEAGRLGGAFFFKRDHVTRGNAKALFTTLAYQLAENDDRLKPTISQTVERYSSIVGREMEVQLHHLIVEPCRALPNSPPSIFLVDGLDECQDDSVQSDILRLIGNAVRKYPTRFRFLVASRPEAAISETVDDPLFTELLTRLNIEQSFNDVRTYLRDEFARIHREHRHTMGGIPTPWPSPDVLNDLVQKSSGYFVYASTVIKFVDDKWFRPTERLNDVLNLRSGAPFKALDQLYLYILSSVPVDFRSRLLDIFQCVAMGLELTPGAIEDLFEWPPGDSQLILRGLRSLLHVPPPGNKRSVSAQHASLLDFLCDEGRSAAFYLDLQTRMHVTRAVLKAFSHEDGLPPTLWTLDVNVLYRCISSVPPSSELVPLFRGLNTSTLRGSILLDPLEHCSEQVEDMLFIL